MWVKKWIGICCFMCTLLSAGCGETGEGSSKTADRSYEVTEYTVPYFGACDLIFVGKSIYYVYEDPEYTYFLGRLDLTTGKAEERGIYFAPKCNIGEFTVDSEGNSYYHLGIEEGERVWNGYFAKLTKEGELAYMKPFPNETLEAIGLNYRIKVEGDDVITYGKTGRVVMDGQGEIASIDQIVEEEKREREEYGAFQGAMYYSKEPFSHEKIFDLIDYGIEHDFLTHVVHYEDGMLVGCYKNTITGYTVYVFTPCEKQAASLPESAAETELTLAVGEADSAVKTAVVEFNKSRSDIHITIKEYAVGEKSAEDGYAGLGADIAGGNAPDLIALRPGEDYRFLVDSGALEDLQPYVEDSSVIHEGNYLKAAWEIGREGGILYGIPTEFSIQTMAGKTALVGEKGGLTFQEIRGLHEKYPHMALLGEESKLNVFGLCIALRAPEFIDYDRGRAEFEKEEFYSLLAFADGFPQEAGKDDREALLQDCYLYSIESFMEVYRSLGTKEVTFTGHPTGGGSVGSRLNQGNYMYGICSRSEYKEECWEFIEGYLTRHYEQKLPLQFSTRKDVLKKQFEKEFEKHGGEYGGFEAYEAYKELEEVCETAGEMQPWEEAMAEILYEELQPYFMGEKTAEKTAEVIQNRVQTYLNEIR